MRKELNTVKSGKDKPRYHHGALREALIAAAGEILTERGVGGFSLREAARRTGVSPAAPAHHFGDSRGLLTAVAADGFRRLSNRIGQAVADTTEAGRLQALGREYVEFAKDNAAVFTIMWMRDILNRADPEYLAAGRGAFNVFERAVSGVDLAAATAPRTPDASLVAAWSMIHGFARLTLDGAFDYASPDLASEVLKFLPTLVHNAAGG